VHPHSTRRKKIKRAGAIISAILLTTWLTTGKYGFQWCGLKNLGFTLALGKAQFYIARGGWPARSLGFTHWTEPKYRLDWTFSFGTGPVTARLRIPLWFPTAIALPITAAAWFLDARATRRTRRGQCPTCAYDLKGLPAGATCPECGCESSKSAEQQNNK